LFALQTEIHVELPTDPTLAISLARAHPVPPLRPVPLPEIRLTLIITRPQKIALKQADTGAGRVNDDVRERQFPNALLKRITAGKPKIFLYILLLDILVYAC
jgi:hypothetical protein